jgi:hypothetical protein
MRAASNRMFAFTVAAAFCLGGAIAALLLLVGDPVRDDLPASHPTHPVWTEMQWPFPVDQWGPGKAFRCAAADCGSEVNLYLRAKLGFCNCTLGVADDIELERMSDLDLIGNHVSPLGAGRPITVAWMKGRSRAYTVSARNQPGKTAISVAFNDRCDMISAMAVLPHDQPSKIEPSIIEFLNSRTVLQWAEITIGL